MGYRVVIGCNFRQYESSGGNFDADRYLILDNIKERQVTADATIATQPMQSGDTIADHMYRNPVKYQISGTFSLNGMNWNDISYNFMNVGDRLTNIQTVFEKIKDDAILCTLITIDTDALPGYSSNGTKEGPNISTKRDADGNMSIVNAATRFKIRERMALQSIQWVEKQNSLDFSFSFVQIIMVEQQEYVNLSDAERLDLGLPLCSQPVGSSLGTVLADNGSLSQVIVKALCDHGYIENEWANAVYSIIMTPSDATDVAYYALLVGKWAILAAAIASVLGAVLIAAGFITAVSIGVSVTAAAAAVFPVGTIIAAAVATVAAIAVAIYSIFNAREEREKKKKAFKMVNDSAYPDLERLINFLDDVELEVNKVNSKITIYNIEYNKPHQVTLNIAGNYYVIEFYEDNTNKNYNWCANITDLDGNPIQNCRNKWTPAVSFTDLNRNVNLWFKDNTKQFEVYLVNPSLSERYQLTEDQIQQNLTLDVVRKQLNGYSIWVSQGDITQNVKRVYDAINKAISDYGY